MILFLSVEQGLILRFKKAKIGVSLSHLDVFKLLVIFLLYKCDQM